MIAIWKMGLKLQDTGLPSEAKMESYGLPSDIFLIGYEEEKCQKQLLAQDQISSFNKIAGFLNSTAVAAPKRNLWASGDDIQIHSTKDGKIVPLFSSLNRVGDTFQLNESDKKFIQALSKEDKTDWKKTSKEASEEAIKIAKNVDRVERSWDTSWYFINGNLPPSIKP